METALRTAAESAGPDARVRRVRMVAGALHALVEDNMQMAYAVLTRGTAAEGSRLEIVRRPVIAACGGCGWSGEITPPFFVCPRCEHVGVEVTGGKELFLEEVETADEH